MKRKGFVQLPSSLRSSHPPELIDGVTSKVISPASSNTGEATSPLPFKKGRDRQRERGTVRAGKKKTEEMEAGKDRRQELKDLPKNPERLCSEHPLLGRLSLRGAS